MKFDKEKLRWDLLPWGPITDVVKVMTFGARKYAPNNWQLVEDAKNRYFAAAMRHTTDWYKGEKLDPESGLHHLAHAVCCLLFALWFDRDEIPANKPMVCTYSENNVWKPNQAN